MKINVLSRENLSHIIESVEVENSDYTIETILKKQVPNYDANVDAFISVYADEQKIDKDRWQYFNLKNTQILNFIIEPGATGATIAAIMSIVLAVASAVYSIVMMNKLNKNKQGETKSAHSIYDVNAQGNQVKLQEIVPENFGLFKRFPDYLADKHVYYKENTMFCDMLLAQGVGFYDYKANHSDVYVGETPINELEGCSVRIYNPGVEITNDNSYGEGSWFCYYSSTEVTASGHTLEAQSTTQDGSNFNNVDVTMEIDTIYGTYDKWHTVGYGGCSGGGQSSYITKEKMDLKWSIDDIIKISDINETRLIGEGENLPTQNQDNTTTITFDTNLIDLDEYLRKRTTTFTQREKIDSETGEVVLDENGDPVLEDVEIITSGDFVNITISKTTAYKYATRPTGTSGPEIEYNASSTNETSLCEIIDIEKTNNKILLKVLSDELTLPTEPDVPSTSSYGTNVEITSKTTSVNAYEPKPDDYPYSDNCIYKVLDNADKKYKLQALNESYDPVPGWTHFYTRGVEQNNFKSEKIQGKTSGVVGPFRACPYGAKSRIFEIDIQFPNGLGHLEDSGSFSNLTIQIEIAYRKAGSNDEWQKQIKEFTNNTNDELAYTFRFEVEQADNYEFQLTNLTQPRNTTKDLEVCKWIGLKSVISTVNKYNDITVLLCRFKGTETLSELSENQLATYWTRKLPDIYTGELEPTTDIAPVLLYIANNSKYNGIVDLDNLKEFDALWKKQNFTLNGTIDSNGTLLDSLQDCAKCGLATPVVKNNKLQLSRIHKTDEITQLFTPQNLTKAPVITFNFPKDTDVDEIVCTYTSPETYKSETLYCRVGADGNKLITEYPDSKNQEKLDIFGVTDKEQAIAMAMRRLRYLKNTRITYQIETELDGLNCYYNDVVGLVLDANISTITGRIQCYDKDQRRIQVDNRVTESRGVIYIRRLNGTMQQDVFNRVNDYTLLLSDGLDFEWVKDYGYSLDLPYYAIGELKKCWVTKVNPSNNKCALTLVNYDEDVFKDDPTE